MITRERQITALQVAAVLVSSLIGVSILALPRIVAEKVNYGAPLATLIGIILGAIGLGAFTYLGMRFPKDFLIEYSEKVIGKWPGKFMGFLFISYFAVVLGLVVREFAEIMNTMVLAKTPTFAPVLVILLLVVITARNDIVTFAYIQFYYAPLMIVPMLLLILIAIGDMKLENIMPFWGNETSLPDFLWAGASVASLPFLQIGMTVITVLIPFMQQPAKAIKGMWWGVSISSIFILLTVLLTIAVMSAEEVVNDFWPTMAMTRLIQLPAQILERVDLLYFMVWVASALTTISSGYIMIAMLGHRLFRSRSHRSLSILLTPVILIIALLPDNTLQTYGWLEKVGMWGLCLTIIYPVFLVLVAKIRRKGVSS
ncbi:GerAB/ArcD/ProY family transporter [Brevibacillus migulae]|uniref:GerAB/ArcD/ProY family transporter n=1 Tax=Brevibacillus migulae TaxID=1644114 RepID=UPI00106E0A13|nr:GerAB/ArcD/ProY family transporter [Brevibacillus migulae]